MKPDLDDTTCNYVPLLTRPFGYKMEVCFRMGTGAPEDDNNWRCWVRIAEGAYDNVLKWPFNGNFTFTLYDQSEQVS